MLLNNLSTQTNKNFAHSFLYDKQEELYVGAGISLTQILDDLKHKLFNSVIENLSTQTNRNFAHSFLYDKQEELYKRLGIPEEKHPGKGNADKQV